MANPPIRQQRQWRQRCLLNARSSKDLSAADPSETSDCVSSVGHRWEAAWGSVGRADSSSPTRASLKKSTPQADEADAADKTKATGIYI